MKLEDKIYNYIWVPVSYTDMDLYSGPNHPTYQNTTQLNKNAVKLLANELETVIKDAYFAVHDTDILMSNYEKGEIRGEYVRTFHHSEFFRKRIHIHWSSTNIYVYETFRL